MANKANETTTVMNRRGEEEEQVVLALVAPYDEVLAVAQAELQRFEDERFKAREGRRASLSVQS